MTIHLIDMDFLRLELDTNHCSAEVKWLRQVSSKEHRSGLELALSIAMELKTELKKTHSLLYA